MPAATTTPAQRASPLSAPSPCSLSSVAADVPANHLDPVGPIVTPPVPDAEGVGNMLRPQEGGQVFVVAAGGVVAADGENGIEPAQRREPAVVVLVHQEIARVVEID